MHVFPFSGVSSGVLKTQPKPNKMHHLNSQILPQAALAHYPHHQLTFTPAHLCEMEEEEKGSTS